MPCGKTASEPSTKYQVFVDSQYIPENPEKRLVDYDRYTPVEFLCATVGDEIAGSMRIIYAPDHSNADSRNQDLSVLSRHSGVPLTGIQSAAFLDSGQNRAGMTER